MPAEGMSMRHRHKSHAPCNLRRLSGLPHAWERH
jgi:hypothetical protein